jgi:S-adenosylmethionine:tRNA ribosyltransferase-isomerase
LHFSSQILEKLKRKGIDVVKITLHVGPGTFMPIRSADIRLHKMEPESYSVPEPVGIFLQECMRSRRKIIAVGSTSVRTLEASYTESGFKKATGYSDLFIIPGYQFKVVQGMITNFHLPESTLLALVCAFAGIDTVIQAYKAAVSDNYRFYSYGDACLVV